MSTWQITQSRAFQSQSQSQSKIRLLTVGTHARRVYSAIHTHNFLPLAIHPLPPTPFHRSASFPHAEPSTTIAISLSKAILTLAITIQHFTLSIFRLNTSDLWINEWLFVRLSHNFCPELFVHFIKFLHFSYRFLHFSHNFAMFTQISLLFIQNFALIIQISLFVTQQRMN